MLRRRRRTPTAAILPVDSEGKYNNIIYIMYYVGTYIYTGTAESVLENISAQTPNPTVA